MFKIINEKGIVHNFAHEMSWGHNIEDFGCEIIEFDKLETQKFNCAVFHYFPINSGDFITRNMQSGKIGLYECIRSTRSREVSDMYDCIFIFCGYYNSQTKHRIIFNGYGIKTTMKSKISWFKRILGG